MHALLDKSHLVSTPIQEGDAGIILKANGTFKIFSTGVKGPGLTEAQRAQGEKLVCLAAALQVPAVMNMLNELVNDPAIAGKVIDLGMMN